MPCLYISRLLQGDIYNAFQDYYKNKLTISYVF